MEHLLYLVHRIPFPPNKGDKIRSYHLLKHLVRRYQVHLGTFVDDPADWQYVDEVRKLCQQARFARLNPVTAKLRSLSALLRHRALSLDYYRDAGMQQWVRETIDRYAIRRVLVFSSAMAQFVPPGSGCRSVIDFVDIDSDKWLQYADKKIWPLSWLYRREGQRLLAYERQVASAFDASLFVSQAEATLFRQLAPQSAAKVDYFNNGVDTEFFAPDRDYANPYAEGEKAIVFTGAMDYWPNIDAVQWFAREIFPSILAAEPQALFCIVGARPSDQVRQLASLARVRVTGSVPDVRPYVAHCRVAVAPLRIARGIQNKVLEAMAMAKTVVVSPQALEGIDAKPDSELLLAVQPAAFARAVLGALARSDDGMGRIARQQVQARYNWERNLAKIDTLLEPMQGPAQARS